MVKQYIQDLKNEFRGYNASKLVKDLLSGVTVAAVALPLALAFGVSSGATPAAGLVTAIIGGIVIGLLSGASFQISGPTGAMSAILITIVAQYGLQGVFAASLAAGVIILLAGIFRLGKLVNFIPSSVVMGFTSGIAIIIALGQVDNFFGTVSEGTGALEKLWSYTRLGFHPNWQALLIGALVVVFMLVWPKKLNEKVPGSLLAIILATVVTELLGFDSLSKVGAIPRSLMLEDALDLSRINLDMLTNLISPIISIAMLGMIESLLCGASASRMKDERFDANRELIAQGVGNILLPFFGGVPATAAIARTSVAIKSGEQTRLTGLFHAVVLFLSMILLGGVMARLPMAALAGVLMVTAWRMNDWGVIRHLFSHKMKGGMIVFLLTPICTVVFDLSIAILAGVAFSCISFVLKSVDNLEVVVSEVDPLRLAQARGEYTPRHQNVRVVYISGSLFFGNSHALMEQLEAIDPEVDALILSIRGVPTVTSSAILGLQEFCAKCRANDRVVCFAGAQPAVKNALLQGGLAEALPENAFFWGADEALASLK